MVANPSLAGLIARSVPAVFVLAGIGVALGVAAAPGETLDAVLSRLPVSGYLPAAAPPVGATGRTVLALAAGALVALLGLVAHLIPARSPARSLVPGGEVVVRRADAHPDAPPRRPIRAADLGQPLPYATLPPVEQPLPADLDLPMSAFDPAAVPDAPLEPVRPVASLARPAPKLAPGERIETFELTRLARPAAPPESPPAPAPEPAPLPVAALEDQSIGALLARLEAVTARRAAPPPPPERPAPPPRLVASTPAQPAPKPAATPPSSFVPANLDETLQKLRRLATAG